MKRLGEKIRILRKRQGLTQTALAGMLDVDQSHIVKMEKGERLPSLEVLDKLMAIFNVSCDQLLKDDREVE